MGIPAQIRAGYNQPNLGLVDQTSVDLRFKDICKRKTEPHPPIKSKKQPRFSEVVKKRCKL